MSDSLCFVVISILLTGCVKESKGTCDVGFWGEDCKRKCAEGCYLGYGCDEDNGVCSHCINGFYGPHCDSKCSDNCVHCDQETGLCSMCEHSWFGNLCTNRCNSSNCIYCDISHGECYNCKPGYWRTYCENECVSGDECLFKCDTGSNSSVCQYACKCIICYKDSGSCKECAAGFWGRGCYRRCSHNCSECSFHHGQCYSCNEGYFGYRCQYKCPKACIKCSYIGTCTACEDGSWGSSCEHRCSHCRSCNVNNGHCEECKGGYWGSSCNYKCHDGCSCCDMTGGACIVNDCQPHNFSISEGTGTEPEQFTTITITGISMICAGFVMCIFCVTLVLVISRRMKNSQENSGKDLYEGSQHQAARMILKFTKIRLIKVGYVCCMIAGKSKEYYFYIA